MTDQPTAPTSPAGVTPAHPSGVATVARRTMPVVLDALCDNAERFTCGEADALASLLTICGLDGAGFLACHASGDEFGDAHYSATPPGTPAWAAERPCDSFDPADYETTEEQEIAEHGVMRCACGHPVSSHAGLSAVTP